MFLQIRKLHMNTSWSQEKQQYFSPVLHQLNPNTRILNLHPQKFWRNCTVTTVMRWFAKYRGATTFKMVMVKK